MIDKTGQANKTERRFNGEKMGFILDNTSTFLFVFLRTTSIIVAAPIFGAVNVPGRVKMGLGLIISMLMVPLIGHVPMPATGIELALGVAGEIIIGVIIGLATRFVFTGIEFAGQLASFEMGIGMATVYDPLNSAQVTVLGRMMSIFTLLIFLSVNGHLMVIMTLKKSFDLIPPYGFHLSDVLAENVLLFSREIFILAIKFAAPMIAILLFINLALGIMARTVPQLNMFVIGFSVTIGVGLLMLGLSMPVFESSIRSALEGMWNGVHALVRVM